MKQAIQWVAVGLLLILFTLLTMGARYNAFTVDEPAHIAVGYSLLARGESAFWIIPQYGNPPLLDKVEALLFYLTKPDIPVEQLAGQPPSFMPFIRGLNHYLLPLERTEILVRTPAMLLTVLLGAIVFRWGRDSWGPVAGILALAILVFDPTLLAHGRLATTDVGTATLGTAALYAAWRWTTSPAWRWALAAAVLLGLTMLAKSSGVLWVVAAGIMFAAAVIQRRRESHIALRLAQGIVAAGLSLLVLWAGYDFTWGPVRGFPLPVPAPVHWEGLLAQSAGSLSASERWVFALGERKQGNWWWYLPLAFLIKNPLPLLIGCAASLLIFSRRPPNVPRLLAVGLFPLSYTALAIPFGMNIGYRYMLAVHPFLYLAIGGGLGQWAWSQRGWRWLLAIGLAWSAVSTLRAFPYELAYFNELVGGSHQADRYLVDSNLDWGQGSKALRDYLITHPGRPPQVAYHFAGVPPDLYGIELEALPPEPDAPPLAAPLHPQPGRYVIGADALQRGWPADPDMYAWFRQIEPTDRLADSMFVYDIEPHRLNWLSQCITPAVPLDEVAVARGFGQTDLRRADFDCTMTWLYPAGGAEAGAYALHHVLVPEVGRYFPSLLLATPQAADPFIARHLKEARLACDLRRYTEQSPAFVIYEQEKPISSPPVAPMPLEGPLTFLGAGAYSDKDGVDAETWWRVTDGPITRPFSIMAHLLAPDGKVLGIADGLGVSPLVLQTGDVIVQRHRFRSPVGRTIQLQVGAYWLDPMERWMVSGSPGVDAIVTTLEVK